MFLLLTISDIFRLSSGLVILHPDFPVPERRIAQTSVWRASVFRSDGIQLSCDVTLYLTHFNIPTTFDVNRRWRVVPTLERDQDAAVAIGDNVVVSDASLAATLNLSAYAPEA